MKLLIALLGAAPATTTQENSGNPWITVAMFVALGAIMYFFMIRPQQKKQKEERAFRESLKVGQAVVTIGGLHGTVKTIEDTAVVLHVSNGVDLRFVKAAINATASAATLEK